MMFIQASVFQTSNRAGKTRAAVASFFLLPVRTSSFSNHNPYGISRKYVTRAGPLGPDTWRSSPNTATDFDSLSSTISIRHSSRPVHKSGSFKDWIRAPVKTHLPLDNRHCSSHPRRLALEILMIACLRMIAKEEVRTDIFVCQLV